MSDNYSYSGASRLRYGTYAANQLTSAYNVTGFPRQADQPNIVDWLEFLSGSDVINLESSIEVGMSGAAKRLGGYEFSIYLGYLTPFMFKYLLDTFWPDEAGSSELTVMVFDRLTGYRVINCTAIRPRASDGQPVGSGWERIPIRCIKGTDAPAGYAFNADFNDDFDSVDS